MNVIHYAVSCIRTACGMVIEAKSIMDKPLPHTYLPAGVSCKDCLKQAAS